MTLSDWGNLYEIERKTDSLNTAGVGNRWITPCNGVRIGHYRGSLDDCRHNGSSVYGVFLRNLFYWSRSLASQLSRCGTCVTYMTDVSALQNWASGLDFELSDGLIQNESNPITRGDAGTISNRWILRWRYRICEATGNVFDINEQGYLYRCAGE
jgi:hypothetical protein